MTVLYSYIEELLTEAELFVKCELISDKINRIINPEEYEDVEGEVIIDPVIKKAVKYFTEKSILSEAIKNKIQLSMENSKVNFPTSDVKKVIKDIMKNNHFKKGAKFLELEIDLEISDEFLIKNLEFLKWVEGIEKTREQYEKFEKYTIDSVKELPIKETETPDLEEQKSELACRILKSNFLLGNKKCENLEIKDLISFARWSLKEEEEFEGLTTTFTKENVRFIEGKVFLGRLEDNRLHDISALVRLESKEIYENLLKERESEE